VPFRVDLIWLVLDQTTCGISNFTSEFWPGEWLFPAMLLADLDLTPLNTADQFVLTYLASDMLAKNGAGVPPATCN